MAGLGMAHYHKAVAYLQEVTWKMKKGDFSRASQSVLCVAERESEVNIEAVASESGVQTIELQSDISLPSTQVAVDRVPTISTSSQSGESGSQSGNQSGNPSGEVDVQSGSGEAARL
ncbi:hypothetical protein PF011_g4284 [Phytophthora fragariae]|uniref:Uncharacterized protein n=1 Tax=Phytophthora fragariae TaxID=53985 RepID=A0A6A3LXE6_9STRA|nr:hypothetical protein PF011_g4284 [Phytophthora fragariae]